MLNLRIRLGPKDGGRNTKLPLHVSHYLLYPTDWLFFSFLKLFSIFKKLFILFLAALGLCCSAWAFSSCSERGLLFVAVRGLLIAVASLVVEHGL